MSAKPTDSNPVARQLRYSLLKYMRSDCFQPSVPVSPEQMRSLFFDTRIMKKLGAVAQVDGAISAQLLDGDPNTFFHWRAIEPRPSASRSRLLVDLSHAGYHVRAGVDAAAKPSRA